MSAGDRWYQETSAKADVKSLAFAAAGVLTAAQWNPQTSGAEKALREIALHGGADPLLWKYLAVGAVHIRPAPSEESLARDWENALADIAAFRDHGVRQVVDSSSPDRPDQIASYSATAHELIPHWTEATERPALVRTVAFAVYDPRSAHRWQWPLLVGLDPALDPKLMDRFKSVRAMRRQFLEVALDADRSPDVRVIAELTPKRLLELEQGDFGVGFIRVSSQIDHVSLFLRLRRIAKEVATGSVALVDVKKRALPSLLDAFADEVAHNKNLDVALFDAHRTLKRAAPAPPILFVPRTDFAGALGEVRLENRARELLGRLEQLPNDLVIGPPHGSAWSLGISPSARRVAHYRRDLSEALDQGRLDFGREIYGGRALRSMSNALVSLGSGTGKANAGALEVIAPDDAGSQLMFARSSDPGGGRDSQRMGYRSLSAEEQADSPAREPMTRFGSELPRYTDVSILAGEWFVGDKLEGATRLADNEPLFANRPYTLEIAIRKHRIGIDADVAAPRAVRNPRKNAETVKILVVAKSLCPDIMIHEPTAAILWPLNADSESALFRVSCPPRGAYPCEGVIEIRLYHDSSLDLLDIVTVFTAIVPEQRWQQEPPVIAPRRLSWPTPNPAPLYIEPDAPMRGLTIHILPIDQGYRFEYLFRREGRETVELCAALTVALRIRI